MCVLESEDCYWNISSPDHSVSESDVIEIECEVLYVSEWLTPVIQCLPETPADVASNNVIIHDSMNAKVTYRKIMAVTSQLNHVTFNCHVSFNSRSNTNINAPVDIHLWTSPAVTVKCKFRLSVKCQW